MAVPASVQVPAVASAPARAATSEPRPPEDFRLEYAEVGAYIRHYSNLRFAMLTVYFAVVGAIGAVALGIVSVGAHGALISRIASIGAALVTAVFYTYEEVCQRYLKFFGKHLRTLEENSGYSLLTRRPQDHDLVENATRALYGLSFAFWVYIAIRGL